MSEIKTNPDLVDQVTQEHLEAVHKGMLQSIQFWCSGLITDQEITTRFAQLSANFNSLEGDNLLKGLLDPNTGLRY